MYLHISTKEHVTYLTDTTRNKAFAKAVLDNTARIRGQVVLDIGAGTGIFSLFFASAGAKIVYAVEDSGISEIAEAVARENHASKIIKVIEDDIKDIEGSDLSGEVDIIVSHWIGCHLLNDKLLSTVLNARTRFLKPGGLMFPESAVLCSALCRVPSMYEFWDDIEGVCMKSFGDKLREIAFDDHLVGKVDPDNILSDPVIVISMDLRIVTNASISHIQNQLLAVANKEGWCQGICLWFTVTFPSFKTEPVKLSTAPEEVESTREQTTVVFPQKIDVVKGTPIAYEVNLKRDEKHKTYDLKVTILDPEKIEHPKNCICNMPQCVLRRKILGQNDSSIDKL